jgi:hypothetical protein
MSIATFIALLPTVLSAGQTLAGIIQNATAAGRTTATAEEQALLSQALAGLGTAQAAFAAQFADVLPKT